MPLIAAVFDKYFVILRPHIKNILWQMRDMILYDDEIECIIANITWNSNDWKETSSDDSGHRWVQEGGVPHDRP